MLKRIKSVSMLLALAGVEYLLQEQRMQWLYLRWMLPKVYSRNQHVLVL